VLENGDRMTRQEFERRYAATSNVKKAELVEGAVHMPSPVRIDQHARPHADLITWLGHYRAHTPGVLVGDNATVRLDLENELQPDGVLWIEADQGRIRVSEDGYLEGAPDLVVEVAASSVSIDLHAKLRAYRRNGVPEYLVCRTEDAAIDWFVLRSDDYQPLPETSDGILKSERFAGLWLDVPALLRGDLTHVLRTLDEGLQNRST
jgi:Uma2 family endonuclease